MEALSFKNCWRRLGEPTSGVEGTRFAGDVQRAKLGAITTSTTTSTPRTTAGSAGTATSGPTANQLLAAATASGSTVHNVQGFITNTADYSALKEPYLKITGAVNGQTVRQSKGIETNQYVDEVSFAQTFGNRLVSGEPGVDAYVWVKPPGESDGSGSLHPERRGQGLRPDVRPEYTGKAHHGKR